MLGIPMEIVGPVLGIGAIILFIAGGIGLVRYFASRFPSPLVKAGLADQALLEDLQARVGELEHLRERVGQLEERLDFTERLLTKP